MSMLRLASRRRTSALVGCHDLAQRRRSERSDRDGECVVRVVLVRSAGAKDTDPRSQGRGHVQDGLAGGNELLGEEVAEPACGLDGPPSIDKRLGPPQQLRDLLARRSDFGACELGLAAVDRDRSVRRLVRVDADDH